MEKVKSKGKTYKAVENLSCALCDLDSECGKEGSVTLFILCSSNCRDDNKAVAWKRVHEFLI